MKGFQEGAAVVLVLVAAVWYGQDYARPLWHKYGAVHLSSSPSSAVDLYSWKDAAGVTHFSQGHEARSHKVHVAAVASMDFAASPVRRDPGAIANSQSIRDEHPETHQGASEVRDKMIEKAVNDDP